MGIFCRPYFYVWPWPFGVGALPAGEGVGGKATVDQGDVRLVLRVLQIQEVLPQLTRIQLALKSDNRVISLFIWTGIRQRNLSLSKINQTPIFLWFELKSSILHDIWQF